MNYSVNYSLISVTYNEKKRLTSARIVCEDTGEIFEGRAHRYPEDDMNIALGTNLAVARAVRKMVNTALNDEVSYIKEWGIDFQFHF